MARLGKFCRIFLEGYGLTTDISNVTDIGNVYDELEVSGYTQDHNYLPGMADATIVLDGYFDDASGSTHTALKTITASQSKLVTVALGNNALPTLGDPAASMDAQEVNYTVSPPRDGVMMVNATFKNRGNNVEWGELLIDTSVTADGQTSSVDNGALSSAGAVAYLHITALSAGDTIVVKVQDSTNNSDWVDLITFALDGSAVDAERATVSGTVNRYVRVDYDVTGTDVSFPIAVNFIRL